MPIGIVDSATLKTWIENGEAVLVDVREPEEYQAKNIPCATLVPLGSLTKAKLPAYHGKKLVMQCKSGGRSMIACQKLAQEDPSLDLYNLEGGILAWSQICE